MRILYIAMTIVGISALSSISNAKQGWNAFNISVTEASSPQNSDCAKLNLTSGSFISAEQSYVLGRNVTISGNKLSVAFPAPIIGYCSSDKIVTEQIQIGVWVPTVSPSACHGLDFVRKEAGDLLCGGLDTDRANFKLMADKVSMQASALAAIEARIKALESAPKAK